VQGIINADGKVEIKEFSPTNEVTEDIARITFTMNSKNISVN
jgi:hypothetical protein